MDAINILEDEVRELVRRRGVDPSHDALEIRRLIASAIDDYDRRSLSGAVPAITDREQATRAVLDSVAGFGPLQPYLDDETIEEIWINEPGMVFVARMGRPELTTTVLTEDQVRDLVERMLKSSGRRLDLSSPFVDATLPGGERLHVVRPDITRHHYAVNIRKYLVRATHLTDLVALGTLTNQAAQFLAAAVQVGLTVLVSGPTHAGKTTMINALAGSIPTAQRVITVEEVFELSLPVRDVVAMQCRPPSLEGTGEIPLRRLVKEALRMRPDRIVVGEVRGAEALDLLIAFNSGVPGLATVHANSAREALTKMTTLPLLAGENITDRFVVPTVAATIDLVVQLELSPTGARRVSEIIAVPGRVEAGIVETATVFSARGGRLARGAGLPPHLHRFATAGFDITALLRPEAP